MKKQTLPVEEARKKFADVLDGSQFRDQHTEITRRGKAAGYVVPPEWYEGHQAEMEALRKKVEELSAPASAPPEKARPAVAAPRRQATQAVPTPADDAAIELTPKETRHLVRLAYARATGEQPQRLHATEKTAKSLDRDPDEKVLDAAYEMGLLTDADVVVVREQLAAEPPGPAADATEES